MLTSPPCCLPCGCLLSFEQIHPAGICRTSLNAHYYSISGSEGQSLFFFVGYDIIKIGKISFAGVFSFLRFSARSFLPWRWSFVNQHAFFILTPPSEWKEGLRFRRSAGAGRRRETAQIEADSAGSHAVCLTFFENVIIILPKVPLVFRSF